MNPQSSSTANNNTSTEEAAAAQITGYLGGPARTRTRFTFWLGTLTLVGFAAVAALGLLAVPADDVQGDAVRIIFVHVPSALGAYAAFGVTAVGSLMWLWRRSLWGTQQPMLVLKSGCCSAV